MIKKILLFVIILVFAISCGKKADPEYKESKYKYINQKNII
tara:strand:- start:431 stop:553 length:123 start_codon:yes stop_codon:yes gene_type:complete